MFKQLLTLAAAACITMGASAATLWEADSEAGLLVDWGQPCVALTPAEVADAIVPGDYINVTTVGVDPENSWPQVALFGQYGGWPPLANEGVGNKTYPYVSSFPVTNELYESISTNGLSVSGNGAYVGKVEVVSSGVEVGPNTVWFGNKECGWGNGVSLPASLFADIRVGDKIAFYVDGVGFQVLLGGWSGLNVPCYEFPSNVTYQDGVATYTMIAEYAEENTYGDKTMDVFELIKANGVIMHGTVTITRIDYIPTDVLEQAIGHATTIEGWEDKANIAPAEDLNIQVLKGDKIRVNAWAGVEGYDIIVAYDEEWNITSIVNVINGKEGTVYENGWAYLYTGNGDEYFTAYLNEGYDGAGAEDGEGFVWLQGFMNNTDFMYYYVEWPLTAEELSEAIMTAYEEDIDQIQEWYEAFAKLQNGFPGYMAVEGAEDALVEISQAIQSCSQAVAAAIEAAGESWGYTSPLTAEITIDITEKIIGVAAEQAKLLAAIENAAEADVEILAGYAEQFEEIAEGKELSEEAEEIAATIAGMLKNLNDALAEAANKAINETAVYVSPLTAEVISDLDALMNQLKETTGISGIAVDDTNAVYYNIYGQQVNAPAAGQVVVKVKNGIATKVYVK